MIVWPNVKCINALANSSSTANIIVNTKMIPLLIEYYKTTAFVRKICFYLIFLLNNQFSTKNL